MRQSLINLSAATLFMIVPASLMAQAPPPDPWSFSVQGGLAVQPEADFKDTDGAFSVDRIFVSASLDYQWNFRNSMGVSIGGGNSDYDFANLGGPEDDAPWGKIENRRLSLSGRFGFGEKGSIFVIPTLRFNGESGASSSDSRSWGMLGGAAWHHRLLVPGRAPGVDPGDERTNAAHGRPQAGGGIDHSRRHRIAQTPRSATS